MKLPFRRNKASAAVESVQSPGAETPVAEGAPTRDASAGSARVGVSNFPSDVCECGGHIGWLDKGDHFEGCCYGTTVTIQNGCGATPRIGKTEHEHISPIFEHRSAAELLESLDLANLEIEALNQINKRLRSERDQAIAQMTIARQQRDEARAIGGAENKAP